MASGDQVVLIYAVQPPLTSAALYSVRTGGSTPAEQIPCWTFDAAADQYLDLYGRLVGYGGSGLTFRGAWMAATATAGGVLWALAIRRIQKLAEDVDTAHTYDYNEVRDVCGSASGQTSEFTITFTSGADMDNLANGEDFILRLRRRGSDNTASTGDDMVGLAQLLSLLGVES